MNMETVNQIITAIMPYVITIVTALAGYLATRISKKFEEKINTQTKKEVAEATVNYVQQVYETLDGKDKLKKALETSVEWLNQKGIKVTEAEMTILIESAIKGAKQGWNAQEMQEIDIKMNRLALNESISSEEINTEDTAVKEDK